MDAMAVSEYVELAWDDFAWLDHPAPALSDAVTEGSVASVLTVTHKGPLDSDKWQVFMQALKVLIQ